MKFNVRKDLIKLAEKYQTVSPTNLSNHILNDFNEARTPQSISMFLKRNPKIEQEMLKKQFSEETKIVEENIFEPKIFKEISSIKKWINEQTTRISPKMLYSQVNAIRNLCQGVFYLKDPVTKQLTRQTIPDWTLKHPDRITLEQIKEFLANLHKANGGKTSGYRLAARAFWYSRTGITVKPQDISGEVGITGQGRKGKYKFTTCPKPDIYRILEELKAIDFRFYVFAKFCFKTATRATAAYEECKLSNIKKEGDKIVWEKYGDVKACEMTIIDKGFHRKGRQTWQKILTEELYNELEGICAMTGNDSPFEGLTLSQIRDAHKQVYCKILTDGIVKDLAMNEPIHFWRHQFAQHMLRETGWNYDIVAFLGGWSGTDIIKERYGAPTKEMLMKEGVSHLPTI